MLETLVSNNTDASCLTALSNAGQPRSLNRLHVEPNWCPPSIDSYSSAPSFRVVIAYNDQLLVDPVAASDAIGSKIGWRVWSHETGGRSDDVATLLIADSLKMLRGVSAAAGQWCVNEVPTGHGWLRTLERIVSDLGRLTDDWDGPGSVVPSNRVLADLETALRCLPSSTEEPEIEADSSDGSVALTWENQAVNLRVTATFVGNGKAFIFISDDAGRRSKSASIHDDVHIQDLLGQALSLQVPQPA